MSATAAWGAALTLITVRDLGIAIPGVQTNPNCKPNRIGPLPAPGDYLATFVFFAPLSVLEGSSQQAAKFANLLAWGWVLGLLVMPCLGTSNITGKAKTPAPSKGNTPGPSTPTNGAP